ncbi:hypothetical protein [Piscirickettsia salmonis]|uniref:hypothetical protein n=1 Tax=Piscirickettsia salmonis TaxID=1238 RepID=UPI003A7FF2D6
MQQLSIIKKITQFLSSFFDNHSNKIFLITKNFQTLTTQEKKEACNHINQLNKKQN